MRDRLVAAVFASFCIACGLSPTSGGAETSDGVLQEITETAIRLCGYVPQSGNSSKKSITGDVKAELSGLAKKLADLDFGGSGTIEFSEYEGVAPEQLGNLLGDITACRQTIFKGILEAVRQKIIMQQPDMPIGTIVTKSLKKSLAIAISKPTGSEPVCALQRVTGSLSQAAAFVANNKGVWVVVHPMLTSQFWVQAPGAAENNGKWTVFVHFGEPGQDVDLPYQFKSFVEPSVPLAEGDVLSWWPDATWSSDVIQVIRGACPRSP